MLEYSILFVGMGIECVLLARCACLGTLKKHPWFFAAVAYGTACDLLMILPMVLWGTANSHYADAYWPAEYSSEIVFFVAMTREISKALRLIGPKMVRPVSLIERCLLALAAGLTVLCVRGVLRLTARQLLALQRDLSLIQALLLVAALLCIFHFQLPVGRHVRGIILGYGATVASVLMSFTLFSYSHAIVHQVDFLAALTSEIGLLVWLKTFWNGDPNPYPQAALAHSTASRIIDASSRVRRLAVSLRSQWKRPARVSTSV